MTDLLEKLQIWGVVLLLIAIIGGIPELFPSALAGKPIESSAAVLSLGALSWLAGFAVATCRAKPRDTTSIRRVLATIGFVAVASLFHQQDGFGLREFLKVLPSVFVWTIIWLLVVWAPWAAFEQASRGNVEKEA